MHGKAEESLDLVGQGVERKACFREVLGPSPSGRRVLAGSREETRMGTRTSDSSPNPTDSRVGVWSPKGVRK